MLKKVHFLVNISLFTSLFEHVGKVKIIYNQNKIDLTKNVFSLLEIGLEMILQRFRFKNSNYHHLYILKYPLSMNDTVIEFKHEIDFYKELFTQVAISIDCNRKWLWNLRNFLNRNKKRSFLQTPTKKDSLKEMKRETYLTEINEYEEVIYPDLKFSIDFYLVKLENFKPINHKNISNDLLSRQMYQLKSLYLTKTLNKTTFVVSKARIEKIQSIKQRLQRLIDIGSKLKYERNDFSDFVNQIAPVKCKS